MTKLSLTQGYLQPLFFLRLTRSEIRDLCPNCSFTFTGPSVFDFAFFPAAIYALGLHFTEAFCFQISSQQLPNDAPLLVREHSSRWMSAPITQPPPLRGRGILMYCIVSLIILTPTRIQKHLKQVHVHKRYLQTCPVITTHLFRRRILSSDNSEVTSPVTLSFPLTPQNHKEDKELPLSLGSFAVTHHSEELVQPCPQEFFKREKLSWQSDIFKLMYRVNKIDQSVGKVTFCHA